MKSSSAVLAMFILCGCAPSHKVLLWMPAGTDLPFELEEKFAAKGIYPHPCGVVHEGRVKSLPPIGAEGYEQGSERVVEFNIDGTIISSWSMPVNSVVLSVKGDAIFTSSELGQLAIENDGSLSTKKMSEAEMVNIQCPKEVIDEFKNSAFVRCYQATDVELRNQRFIAYEQVCT